MLVLTMVVIVVAIYVAFLMRFLVALQSEFLTGDVREGKLQNIRVMPMPKTVADSSEQVALEVVSRRPRWSVIDESGERRATPRELYSLEAKRTKRA